ncbi:MAG: helicase C-terminal domain-containing protein [Gemmatimonadales bacterium]
MSRIPSALTRLMAEEISNARGREVSFVAEVDGDGKLVAVRTVARGTVDCVLALPGVANRGEMVLHNHPDGMLDPSAADLNVAAQMHDSGVGFGIINNSATELYVVVEVPQPRSVQPIDSVKVADMLGKDGSVARMLAQYEDRPSQRDMASYVADVYNDGGIALLEAGTGVGKSFAYLVPAVVWAERNRERTVVSTNTINLQEQLIGKDLPFLADALKDEQDRPTFAMLKGWRNYVCLARLDTAQAGESSLFDEGKQGELRELADWANRTADGSLADLTAEPSREIWDEVSAEPDLCTRQKCPYFDQCFVFEARRRAAAADVVVVNHHLLAADLAVRREIENWQEAAVLPPYRRLIVDEAHHLEDTATQHLGSHVSAVGVGRLLARLERNGKGLIPTLITELSTRNDSLSDASADLLRTSLLSAVTRAKAHAERVFRIVCDLLSDTEGQLRLDDGFALHPIWGQGLDEALDNFVSVLSDIRNGVETIADRMELAEDPDRQSQLLRELRGVVRRLEAVLDGVRLTLRPAPELQTVRWIERRGKRPLGNLPFPVALESVPLDIAQILRDSLFERVDTVVLTSATLATGGDYEFLKNRVGLSELTDTIKYEEILPSPFDFSAQCFLGIPTDVPDPRRDEVGHDRAVVRSIVDIASVSDGGMFVLFTSHAALRRVASALREQVGARWPLLVQGEGQRDHLLRRFRALGNGILLGTDSFWEGVDVPGPALRALLIAKLPFRVPTEPITAARLDLMRERGEDGFLKYQVPQAALKLKQGFGRLIRSKSDTGVVVLMDRRVVSQGYGKLLLQSLPPADQFVGCWTDVRSRINDFFAARRVGAAV